MGKTCDGIDRNIINIDLARIALAVRKIERILQDGLNPDEQKSVVDCLKVGFSEED
jgi:hypothetical protein